MAQHQVRHQEKTRGGLDQGIPVWAGICREAEELVRREPELATFIFSTILHHDRLEAAVVHRLAQRLRHPAVSAGPVRQAYESALEADPSIAAAFRVDIVATV